MLRLAKVLERSFMGTCVKIDSSYPVPRGSLLIFVKWGRMDVDSEFGRQAA